MCKGRVLSPFVAAVETAIRAGNLRTSETEPEELRLQIEKLSHLTELFVT